MASTVASSATDRHVLLPEKSQGQAKAEVRKADDARWRIAVGQAIEDVRLLSKLSLKEFADAIDRDERQVARWISGADRPQFDALLKVEKFRQPLVHALSLLAGADVEITVRLRAAR